MSTNNQNMNQAFSDLERIVEEFEDGKIDLEESLPKFKQGLELVKYLKAKLKAIENQIIEIKDEVGDLES
ncbi:MAG: exodeoxyribonuclease VII small subunit [Patescibacteria group bacterium]